MATIDTFDDTGFGFDTGVVPNARSLLARVSEGCAPAAEVRAMTGSLVCVADGASAKCKGSRGGQAPRGPGIGSGEPRGVSNCSVRCVADDSARCAADRSARHHSDDG